MGRVRKGLDTRGLRIVVAFGPASRDVSAAVQTANVIQEARVVLRHGRAAFGIYISI